MIKAVLFDMDGTIADTMRFFGNTFPDFVASVGKDPGSLALPENVYAMPLEETAAYLRDQYQLEMTVEEVVASLLASIDSVYTEKAPLKPGAADFLARLHEAGVKILLVTNNEQSLAEALLRRNGVHDYFDGFFCGANLGLGKEEPTLIRTALDAHGIAPEEAWMFEDSLVPMQTAQSIGVHAAAMLDPFHAPAETAAIKETAEAVFADYTEALPWLESQLA
ncbi:MAG: HAD family hydrolase [Peptococcaceae bacterium]|nr:HAD family hydrolase [Peptococcaceae bacterium]